jgi:alpha-galactosidase
MNRREYIQISAAALIGAKDSNAAETPMLHRIRTSVARAATVEGAGDFAIDRKWSGDICRSRVLNCGKASVRVKEVVLFSINHDLPAETHLYGESFQMLSQTGGTLGAPVDLGYSEQKHYKIPQPDGVTALSSMMTLTPANGPSYLLAYTSCRRFNGRFFVKDKSIEVVIDTEGLELGPGESWDLEDFHFASGNDREALLATLAGYLNRNHSPLKFPAPPTGWCSWYYFGPRVTAKDVLANLDVIGKEVPGLKYVQIDDGYQAAMGDWLDTGTAFGGDVQGVLKEIRKRGYQPAIWVAPFIAESGSKLFNAHPDWFMKDTNGTPLPASKVTFQGWRRGPWYALDGTHPEVQKHFESLFHTMRNDWGCTYFKLDANFWGAMHGGKLHDRKATRIEAYRRGMQAILKGAGDSFILGCNHPIWPSLGLIHGSRSSADIKRAWNVIEKVARQNLNRNWQNGRLWWNDPDAVVLHGSLPLNEFLFHATSVYATGGMVLSGDDLTQMPADRIALLKKLLPPTGVAAKFEDDSQRMGVVDLNDRRMVCLLNWGEHAQILPVKLTRKSRIQEYWSGEDLGVQSGEYKVEMPPHSGRILECVPA